MYWSYDFLPPCPIMTLLTLKSFWVIFSGYFVVFIVVSGNLENLGICEFGHILENRINQQYPISLSLSLLYQPLLTATVKLLQTEWFVCDKAHTQSRARHLWDIVKFFSTAKPSRMSWCSFEHLCGKNEGRN